MVVALGGRGQLVGRSEECDFPPEVRSLPVVMRAKTLDREAPAGEIDARVSETRRRGESLYTLDLPLLRSLGPDIILTQDLCGVCSVTEAEVIDACRAVALDPTVISLNPRRLTEVKDSIGRVAAAIGRPEDAEALQRRFERPASRAGAKARKRVAVVEWLEPAILAGLWVPDMIELSGGTSVGPSAGEPGQRLDWVDLRRMEPDLVIVSPCSFDVRRTAEELRRSQRTRADLPKAPDGCWLVDEAYFSRPGPRLADGVELLQRLLRHDSTSDLPMPAERWTGIADH